MATTVVRPLRTALIDRLESAVTLAGGRVWTPPIDPEKLPPKVQPSQAFPHLLLDAYTEDEDNFFGRSGSRFRCQVKGRVRSNAGDRDREALWEQVYTALHRVPITVTGHLHLFGTLRRTATYTDPDGVTLHFVGTYDASTRVAA